MRASLPAHLILHLITLIASGRNERLEVLVHPSNGATAQIGPWPLLLRFNNNNVLRCEVVCLTTNPR
jgi:hypothetical protein